MVRFVVKTNITAVILFNCLRNLIYFKSKEILKASFSSKHKKHLYLAVFLLQVKKIEKCNLHIISLKTVCL